MLVAVSKNFVNHVLDMLSPSLDITTGRLFSGVLLKHHKKQLGVIWQDTLYFRVPEHLQAKYKNLGSEPFQYTKKTGMVTVNAYWTVPTHVLDDSEQLLLWAKEILFTEENKARTRRAKCEELRANKNFRP